MEPNGPNEWTMGSFSSFSFSWSDKWSAFDEDRLEKEDVCSRVSEGRMAALGGSSVASTPSESWSSYTWTAVSLDIWVMSDVNRVPAAAELT